MNFSTVQDAEVVQIASALLRRDGGTQPRAAMNHQTVTEYATDMGEGAQFPPVVVFYDGSDYWLADGFHRVEAACSIEITQIAATVRQGTIREAMLYSVGVNATHGLRRTSADKRRSVMTLLSDKEWSQWSNREIARQCGVHHQMVGKIRGSLDDSSSEKKSRTFTTKHGTTASMNTAAIGKKEATAASIALENNSNESSLVSPSFNISNRVKNHSLFPSQTNTTTQLPNRENTPLKLVGGEREMIKRKDLLLEVEEFNPKPSAYFEKNLVEVINFKPELGYEYYVRVRHSAWENLKQYQQRIGVTTPEDALERLLADAIANRLLIQ